MRVFQIASASRQCSQSSFSQLQRLKQQSKSEEATMLRQTDKAAEAADEALPAYTQLPAYTREPETPATPSTTTAAVTPLPPASPPNYRQAAYFTPYVPIPQALYGMKSTSSRGLYLCAKVDDTTDKLFFAGHHRGLLSSPALGSSPGVQLHNGIDSRACVLAAAAEPRSQPLSMHGVCSVLILPPPPPPMTTFSGGGGGGGGGNYIRVFMEMARTPADPTPVYRLSLDIGTAEVGSHTAEFAWCRAVGGERSALPHGSGSGGDAFPTFHLVRKLSHQAHEEEKFAVQKGGPPRTYCEFPKTLEEAAAVRRPGASSVGDDGEVVGVLSYSSTLKTYEKLFKAELRGSAAEGLLGDRCKVMIIMTAVNLYYINTQQRGKSSKTSLLRLRSEKKNKEKNATGEKGTKREAVAQVASQGSLFAAWD